MIYRCECCSRQVRQASSYTLLDSRVFLAHALMAPRPDRDGCWASQVRAGGTRILTAGEHSSLSPPDSRESSCNLYARSTDLWPARPSIYPPTIGGETHDRWLPVSRNRLTTAGTGYFMRSATDKQQAQWCAAWRYCPRASLPTFTACQAHILASSSPRPRLVIVTRRRRHGRCTVFVFL